MNNYMAIKWITWKKWTDSQKTRLNQEEIEIISTEMEAVIKKKLPKNKSPGPDGFTGDFYQTYREELTSILLNSFKKLQQKEHIKLIL